MTADNGGGSLLVDQAVVRPIIGSSSSDMAIASAEALAGCRAIYRCLHNEAFPTKEKDCMQATIGVREDERPIVQGTEWRGRDWP